MKIKQTRILSLLAAALFCAPQVFAQGEALPFIRIDRNPRTAAMAGAGAASSYGIAYSSFRNAAVIPFFTGTLDAGVNYQRWAPDGVGANNVDFGAGVKLNDKFGFSVGGAYQMGTEYMAYGADGLPGATFSPYDVAVNAGFAYRVIPYLSVGVNLRYASSTLGEGNAYSGFGADVMLLYRSETGLSAAAGVSSVGTRVSSGEEDFSLPTSATAALAYGKTFGKHGVEAALDLDYYFSGNITAALGLEYNFNKMVFVRGGYHFGTEAAVLPSFATAGLGVRFFGVSLDFAYLTANRIIGNSFTVGLGYSF